MRWDQILSNEKALRPKQEMGVVAPEMEEAGEEEEEEYGSRNIKKMQDPRKPSQLEIDHHNLSHLPYRSWCRHCVRGRGKEAPHMKSGDKKEGEIPEFHFDWCFPGEEKTGDNLCVLVGRMRETRMTMSSVTPGKSTNEFISRRMLAFLRECGCEMMKIIVKTDQEPAVAAIVDSLVALRASLGAEETVPEHSPTYSSQSNGIVERGIQSVEGMIRSLRSALEERINAKLDIGDSIWAWLVEYASYLLNRLEVGKDGKTAYERNKGKHAKVQGVEFGEAILWKRRPVGGALGKLAIMWKDGIFLGVKGTTNEIIIGSGEGIYRTRTILRKPVDERWREDLVKKVQGVPWKKSENDPQVDGESMKSRPLSEEEKRVLEERQKDREAEAPAPKRFGSSVKDIIENGVTVKCGGCRSAIQGCKNRLPHTPGCRERFSELLKEDSKVKASAKREKEFCAKVLEEDHDMRAGAKRSADRLAGEEPEASDKRSRPAPTIDRSPAAASSEHYNPPSPSDTDRDLLKRSLDERQKDEQAGSEDVTEREGKRRLIGLIEGRGPGDSSEGSTNDDELEKKWAEVMIYMIENHVDDRDAQSIYDDLTGLELNGDEVAEARREEMQFVKDLGVYEEATIEECWTNTGKGAIGSRWVDILKGLAVRSRWVAQDFKVKGEKDREDLFASMPPLEAKKALFRVGAARLKGRHTRTGEKMQMMFIDVRKAHLNAKCDRDDQYVKLPAEAEAKAGICGRLLRWLYGMRGAAQGWETEFTEKLESIGFKRGTSTPVVFHREEDDAILVVHGDDFTFLGLPKELKEIRKCMESWWDLKLRAIIGDGPGDDKTVTILNRNLTWDGSGFDLTADPKHREEVLKEFGLTEESRGLSVPIEHDEAATEEDLEPLEGGEIRRFRSITARCNYLSQDRPDIQFAVKEISRDMAKPTLRSMRRLKRIARYLLQVPRGVIRFEAWIEKLDKLMIYVDSNWAGCKTTRRSTSAGAASWGRALLKTWSRTQGSVALSSGEA